MGFIKAHNEHLAGNTIIKSSKNTLLHKFI